MVKDISEKGLFIKVWSLLVIIAIINPINIPPMVSKRNCSISCKISTFICGLELLEISVPVLIGEDVEPNTIPTTNVKIIIPVASLNDDSISSIVESNLGTFSILNVLITIAASVGEIKAAKINAN